MMSEVTLRPSTVIAQQAGQTTEPGPLVPLPGEGCPVLPDLVPAGHSRLCLVCLGCPLGALGTLLCSWRLF